MLLRSVSGYMAAPRAPFASDASQFDRIIVMPTSAAPRPAVSSAPPPFAQTSQQPLNQVDDEELRTVMQPPRGSIFSTFPQLQGIPAATPGSVAPSPQQAQLPLMQQFTGQIPAAAPSTTPAAQPAGPAGAVSTPGMVAPTAAQPGLIPQGPQPRRTPNDN